MCRGCYAGGVIESFVTELGVPRVDAGRAAESPVIGSVLSSRLLAAALSSYY